ncbi:DUF177 domain-containing protein [Proteinivorax hydrogeniformans]|uniref:DUF177 domain-containing protein n=1 Tax=Proteinivorax hydrogeniformans TaxID=1826727 RepID=A0AAU8HPE4_9FIRM
MVNNLLTIDLMELETEKNLTKKYDYTLPEGSFNLGVPNVDLVEPIVVSVVVSKEEQTYLVEGYMRTQLKLPCDRCLSLDKLELDESFKKKVLVTDEQVDLKEEDAEGFYRISVARLQLQELLQEVIEFAIPSKFLCQKDCLGLCNNCGTNLNESQCDCDKESIDPRLAVLKKFYNEE